MSDLGAMIEMLKSSEIPFTESTEYTPDPIAYPLVFSGLQRHSRITILTIEGGYIGFVTQMTFSSDGKLLKIGAYE